MNLKKNILTKLDVILVIIYSWLLSLLVIVMVCAMCSLGTLVYIRRSFLSFYHSWHALLTTCLVVGGKGHVSASTAQKLHKRSPTPLKFTIYSLDYKFSTPCLHDECQRRVGGM